MRRYPQEVHAFLSEFIPGHTAKEISAELFERFGLAVSPSAVKSYKTNHHLPSGTKSGIKKGEPTALYPAAVLDFVARNHSGHGPAEMTQMLNDSFGTEYQKRQIKALYHNRGWSSGLTGRFEPGHVPPNKGKKGMPMHPNAVATQFKKGRTPHNKTEIGTVVKRTDGYLWKKIGEGARDWKQLHILNWEEVNGPIPEGYKLLFLDGNPENVDLDNLHLMTNETHMEMIRKRLRSEDPDLMLTGSLLAELNVTTRKKVKRSRET